jgi:hypothetical protein
MTPARLQLTLYAGPVRRPLESFPVTARFTNCSRTKERMLKLFDPLPVFFTTTLMPVSGGIPIDVAGMGKADPFYADLRYEVIEPGATFEVALDLAPWIRAPVPPGPYWLSLEYHNAYGSDCFLGPLASEPITVPIGN